VEGHKGGRRGSENVGPCMGEMGYEATFSVGWLSPLEHVSDGFIALTETNRIAGWIIMTYNKIKKHADVESLAVVPLYRGQRIATRLMGEQPLTFCFFPLRVCLDFFSILFPISCFVWFVCFLHCLSYLLPLH